ncbi:MAG: HAMP domain-containing protein, partial [Myxococcales bacterium]|nr:HAMP domain-containing protein [Myxococcales bacterium]
MRRVLQRISSKLILATVLGVVVVIAVFAWIISHSQEQALTSHVKESAVQLSETVKRSAKYDMLVNRRESVHQIIDTIGRQEGIEKVRIFNKEGAIIYSSDKKEVGKLVNKRHEKCYACHAADKPLERLSVPDRTRIFTLPSGERNLGVINPIYNEPSCSSSSCHAHSPKQKILGVLDITMSLTKVDLERKQLQLQMIGFMLCAVGAIGLVLWYFVRRWVGKPLRELQKATGAVARGELSYQIRSQRDDELGEFAHSFDNMTRELAQAQQKINQASKLASVGRLAAGVAHEINNPLTGVLTYSSYLLKRAENNSETKEDLEVIVRETKRCRKIVKGLLDFSRQVPPKKTLVELDTVIRESTKIVDNQLTLNKVEVELALGDVPAIRADFTQLQQVFINLLLNAADAMPRGGKVRLTSAVVEHAGESMIESRV